MFMKKPRHRIFDYTPRFYDPETDPLERKKRQLGFRTQRKNISRKKSPVLWIALILVIIFILLKLQNLF
jgi:uncharacterized membrane protein YvbJ